MNKKVNRREFLQTAGAVTATRMMRLGAPALLAISEAACTTRESSASFEILSSDDAADFAAIAARIIPTTNTPGATEAGVIYFFDAAFAREMKDDLDSALSGLADVNSTLRDGHRFADLGAQKQDAVLTAIEASDFFGLMRQMTIFGFFSMSSYGGNKDDIAWQLIGFDGHQRVWNYPFGDYDAEVHGGSADGE